MQPLLVVPIAVAVLDIGATYVVLRTDANSQSNRFYQLMLVWLLPVLGAVFCILVQMTQGKTVPRASGNEDRMFTEGDVSGHHGSSEMTRGVRNLCPAPRIAASLSFAFLSSIPGIALAEGGSSNPGGIFIFFVLFPAGLLALLIFLVLACFKRLHGSIYALATFAFIPYGVVALRILNGPLSFESDVVQYFYALLAIFTLTTVAFGVMTTRYWKRYVYISRKQ